MKYAKRAAVIAGSLLALGSVSPALADDQGAAGNTNWAAGADGPNFSLDNGLAEATKEHPLGPALLRHPPVGVSGPQADMLKNAVHGLTGVK